MSDVAAFKMQRDIQEMIRRHVEEAKKDVEKMALDEFTRRLRDILGRAAINISEYYSVQRLGPDLLITVKIEHSHPPVAPNSEAGERPTTPSKERP